MPSNGHSGALLTRERRNCRSFGSSVCGSSATKRSRTDGRAALEREHTALEDDGRHLDKQSGGINIKLIHGLSTNRPSLDRETQVRLLPVGSRAGDNFEAHGSESSRPNRKQSRTVLTLEHRFSKSSSTSVRKVYMLSANSRASCRGCRTPTSNFPVTQATAFGAIHAIPSLRMLCLRGLWSRVTR
jgi:hypothetical protein